MGLKDLKALRSFCAELSTDAPSPGGGAAAAAAGAMAASLLVMVCGVTSKSKKHAANKAKLQALKSTLERMRDDLVSLAREDARAYDLVIRAVRRSRAEGGSGFSAAVLKATKYAAEVPMRTAELCIDVLKEGVTVSELGTRNASSDVGVAILLAHSGYMGAAMNVRINLESLGNLPFAKSAGLRLRQYDGTADRLREKALSTLRKRSE